MITKKLTIAALAVILSSTSALADDSATQQQLQALQEQIKQLQAQLNQLQKQQQKAQVVTAKQEAATARAEAATAKQEAATAAAAKNINNANVEFGPKGIKIASPDNQYSLRVGGYVQGDLRKYTDTQPTGVADQFLVRAARPTFDFNLPDKFSGRIQLDFGSGQARMTDGYGDWNESDEFNIRAGKFKAPVGLERWEGESELLFAERGLSTDLVPFRDIGVGTYGKITPEIEYQLGITDGQGDLVDPSGGIGDGKDFNGRIFTQPFKNSGIAALQGFGVGIAGTAGDHQGNATTGNSDLSTGLKTTAQNNFFTYTPASGTVYANGADSRINPQAWYYNGPVSVLGEYVRENYEVSKSTAPTVRTSLTNDAWTAIATYVITGENASFTGVKPDSDFNLSKGTWGAFEVAGRVGKLNVDHNTFPTYALVTTSATSVEERVIGLNWYMNQNVKVNLDFASDSFTGGAITGNRPDENSILAQVQFKF